MQREKWQRGFYDSNVWTERKRIEKLRYMHRKSNEAWSPSPSSGHGALFAGMPSEKWDGYGSTTANNDL
jgi:hypothetical protein